MIDLAKQILHEIENNPTILQSRKTGMRVAVGYVLSKIEDTLIEMYCLNSAVIMTDTNSDFIRNQFKTKFCYDPLEIEEKRLAKLEEILSTLWENNGK